MKLRELTNLLGGIRQILLAFVYCAEVKEKRLLSKQQRIQQRIQLGAGGKRRVMVHSHVRFIRHELLPDPFSPH